jgi:hypothetical protein
VEGFMTIEKALKILGLERNFNIIQLKEAYFKASKKTHPDAGGTDEAFIEINNAYDTLKHCAGKLGKDQYNTWIEQHLSAWRKEFIKDWRHAHELSFISGIEAGMYYRTTIEKFKRARIDPPKEWFYGALFKKPDEKTMQAYREHLLAIAPNQTFREPWAKEYFELEFHAAYVFYLPPAKEVERSTTIGERLVLTSCY